MKDLLSLIEDLQLEAEKEQQRLMVLKGLYPHILIGDIKKPAGPSDYNRAFEASQNCGVNKFGFEWISANERAIQVAEMYNLDVTRLEIKAFISEVVMQILSKP